jgi:hypothetical protein
VVTCGVVVAWLLKAGGDELRGPEHGPTDHARAHHEARVRAKSGHEVVVGVLRCPELLCVVFWPFGDRYAYFWAVALVLFASLISYFKFVKKWL